jgi:serine/threonine protein phosphatase PrpC
VLSDVAVKDIFARELFEADEKSEHIARQNNRCIFPTGLSRRRGSGLPLGIVAGLEYTETSIRLEQSDTLAMLTDGLVEAQSRSGELFGFERTRNISVQSAAKIAGAAQAFGQTDDITVLCITLAGEEEIRS